MDFVQRSRISSRRDAAALMAAFVAAIAVTTIPVRAQTLEVKADYEASGAGYKEVTTSDGTGALPHKILLPEDATSMTFAIFGGTKTTGHCTAPCITINGGITYSNADGVGNANSANLQSDESISGIQSPTIGFVAGVFESGPPKGDAPPALDFKTIGTDFPSLSPILRQLFFIGDGLTGDGSGSVQVFDVPSGAKTLYLGIVDACDGQGQPACYGDNTGDFILSYAISTESGAPAVNEFAPASGKVGSSVKIWGYNLLTATGVRFHGKPAKFTAESTLLHAIVPVGATTGPIEVTTPDGKVESAGKFTVTP